MAPPAADPAFLQIQSVVKEFNGYRAVDGAALARLQLVEDRFSAPEILIQAAGHGLRIREVPVHIRSREVGVSKKPRGLGYAWGFLGAIVRSWVRART